MIKDKSRLAFKLFIMVWIMLIIHITLKLTFNYWQPYVIPNDTLGAISDFIDNNRWLEVIIDKSYYLINGFLMVLSSIQEWKFNKKYPIIILVICAILSSLDDLTPFNAIIDSIITIFASLILPLIINKKKILWTILTFALTNLYLAFSLWLSNFVKTDDMPHIIQTLFLNDYYIMLILNYMLFNFIRIRKENNKNG